MKVDKEKAVALRKQGLTYKEISETLGCSEVWCKVNLKSVQVASSVTTMSNEALYDAIETLMQEVVRRTGMEVVNA